jgi:hypothetical protein
MKSSSSWSSILVKTFIVSGLIIVGLNVFGNLNSSNSESYFEKKKTVEQIENSEPLSFLTTDGNYSESFWGTKIKVYGKITNKATVATFKDVTIRITYYTKTKTVLRSKDYTIYELFPPNSVKSFELRIENYKNTNSIDWDVIKALVY